MNIQYDIQTKYHCLSHILHSRVCMVHQHVTDILQHKYPPPPYIHTPKSSILIGTD